MTTKAQPKDFGRYIRTHRRAGGITLESVAQQTKIRLDCLRKIESEDLANLPAPVFVKGFIRAFANAIGADPAEAVARYQTHLVMRKPLVQMSDRAPSPFIFWRNVALAAIVFLCQCGATLYLAEWMHTPSEHVTASARAEAASPPPEVTPAARIETAPAEIQHASGTEASNLKLHMTAVESTWLKVVLDGKVPKEMMLQPGERVLLEAKTRFNLIIGNAGGVRLKLNDHTLDVPGRSGQVVNLRLP